MNKKTIAIMFSGLLTTLSSVQATTGSLETIKQQASLEWTRAFKAAFSMTKTFTSLEISPDNELSEILENPKIFEERPQAAGPLLGAFSLAKRLDAHSSLLNRRLGTGFWDMTMASDPTFSVLYMVFRQDTRLVLHRLKKLQDLLDPGVTVKLDAKTAYQFALQIVLINPTRKSVLKMFPANNGSGDKHSISTGDLLDRLKANSFVFLNNRTEYWVLYGTDVDPKTNQFVDTRTILFIRFAGTDSKAWPVAESSLQADSPINIGLGKTILTLLKTSDGRLEIYQPSLNSPAL